MYYCVISSLVILVKSTVQISEFSYFLCLTDLSMVNSIPQFSQSNLWYKGAKLRTI